MPVRDQVYVEILADTRKAGKSFVNFAAKAATVYASVRAVTKVLGDLTEAASRANEVNSKFNVTFSQITDRASEVARALQDAYGLSTRESEELLASTGDLLSGFGFTQEAALEMAESVNTLAVDLASFQNLSGGAEQASQALTKALLGERESIKTLGIAITEADIKRLAEDKGIVGELDRQQKAMLTLELAVKQSKNAIGDFERTSDSYANQSRVLTSNIEDLKVALGENLAPAAAKAKKQLNESVSAITAYLNARTKLRDLKGIDIESLSVNEQIAATQAKIVELQRKQFHGGRQITSQIAERLGFNNTIIDRIEEQKSLLADLKTRQDKIVDAVDQEAQLHELINEKLAYRGQIDATPPKTEEQTEAERRLAEAYAKTDEARIEALQSNIAYFETFKQGPKATAVLKMLNDELDRLTDSHEEQKSAVHESMTALDTGLVPITTEAAEMYKRMGEAAVAANAVAKGSTEDATEAVKRAREAFSQYASYVGDVFGSLTGLSNAFYDAEIQNAEGNEKKQKQLMRERAIAEKTLKLFEATINTAAAVVAFLAKGDFIGAIAAGITGGIQVATIAATPIPALAEGGIVDKPTLAMIGEAGPEAVVPLNKGMGGNVTVIVQGSMVRERDVARMITSMQARNMGAY